MSPDLTNTISTFVAELNWADVPESARVATRHTAANVIGLSVGAAHSAAAEAVLEAAADLGQRGDAQVLGRPETLTPPWAALVNGLTAHVEDFDDTYLSCILHPGAPIVPAALAVAELVGADGETLMTGVVAGVEVASRLGDSLWPSHFDRGWHVTATTGPIGAACAAARVLDLDAARTAHAIAIAATQAAGHTQQLGSMTKSFQVGRAAATGVEAALMAEQGFTGPGEPLAGRRGMSALMAAQADWTPMTDLGRRWLVESNALKPYSCGIVSHPVIDAGRRLRSEGLTSAQVESVELQVHPRVLDVMGVTEPADGLQSKFSVYHCFAVGLVRGAGGPNEFSDSTALDSEIAGIRGRVSVALDPALAADSCRAAVTTTDGHTVKLTVDHATGSIAAPMSEEELCAKVVALAAQLDNPDRLWDVARRLDDITSTKDLFAVAG
jgi:2-methylcitrate dehydratase PrpD